MRAKQAFTFEGYTLDLRRGCLRAGEDEIKLRPKCLDLLRYLVENPGRLLLKDELAEAIWPNVIVSDDSLAQCISDLRHALNDVDRRIIKTITRRGYLFAPPVSISNVENASHSPASAPRLSIVVLPFVNLSDDPEQEYFVDGITDDLTTDLSRISESFVIARNTAFTYKGKLVDARQIGRELGVRYILEGTVRRAEDQVRVNVQLIDAASGAHVWADRFETDRANLAGAQDEITGRLARTLNFALVGDVGRRIDRETVIDLDARDVVMRGWACLIRSTSSQARQEARRAFEQALVLDPQSVDAKVYLAITLVLSLLDGWSRSPLQDQAQAEQLLVEVLEQNPSLPKARFAMGMLRRIQGALTEAQIELERAIALDRNYANAACQLGLVWQFRGQPEAAIPYVEKAIRLSPHDPNLGVFLTVLGACHLLLGRADRATDLLRRGRAINPQYWYIHFWLAGIKGELSEAVVALAKAIELKPGVSSRAKYRAQHPWEIDPAYLALRAKTVDVGLRRAGFPDE